MAALKTLFRLCHIYPRDWAWGVERGEESAFWRERKTYARNTFC
jgi:hypothetical protein